MEENNVSANNQQANTASAQNKADSGTKAIRIIVMLFIQVANMAFCAMMGYLLVTFLMTCFGANLGSLFGYEGFDLGFMETLGVLAIMAIILVAGTIISIAVGFVASNQKYYNVLKSAQQENLKIVLAPRQTISSIVWMIIAILIMAFFSLYFAQNGIVSLTSILLYISIAALTLAVIFTVVLCIVNRTMYNKLSTAEQNQVKEQSEQFKVKVKKRERNKQAGKLY